MACYNHVEKTEICTCTYCGKHLCQDCHKKIKDCLVCKTGDCSTKIDDKRAFHKKDHCHQSLCGRHVPYLSNIMQLVEVIIFLWGGYHFYKLENHPIAGIFLLMGILVVLRGLFHFYRCHQMK